MQCIKYVFEGIGSTCDVDVVTNEFKYSLRKNGENWRYFRQRFALYPFAMEKCILSVKCQTIRPYLIIAALGAPYSNGHDLANTFENTGHSRLESFGMTAGKLVPLVNFYKDPEATGVARIFLFRGGQLQGLIAGLAGV